MKAFRGAVRFTEAAARLPRGVLILEVGPAGVLRSPLRQSRPDLPYAVAMCRGCDAAASVPEAVAQLWCQGTPVAWPAEAPPSACAAPERALLACPAETPPHACMLVSRLSIGRLTVLTY